MPKVSIISIAPDKDGFTALQQTLKTQTFQDFELITEVGSNEPETWKRGIARAGGEILVFLEAGARPVNDRWLEELAGAVTDEHTIAKGLEITGYPLDPSSLAGSRQAFIDHPFDESYPWSEDTELFCRLKDAGYRFQQLQNTPVIHLQKPGSKTFMRRAFRYGIFMARLRHRYAQPADLMSFFAVLKSMAAALLNLTGVWVGSMFYPRHRQAQRSLPSQTLQQEK